MLPYCVYVRNASAVPRVAWLQGADLSSHSMDFCVPGTLGISVFSAGIEFQPVFLISVKGHVCEQLHQVITPAYPGCHTLSGNNTCLFWVSHWLCVCCFTYKSS